MNIITYAPVRDLNGRFTTFISKLRGRMMTVLFWQLIVLSLLGNAYQFRQAYNIRCAVNSQVVGWFTSKEKCGELEQNWFAAEEQSRMAIVNGDNN